MKENEYQGGLIKRLKQMFPGCIVLKNDPNYLQGFPDLTLLWERHWAVFEVKKSDREPHRQNQDYYVYKCNAMSYGAFICPQNEGMVLDELQQAWGLKR